MKTMKTTKSRVSTVAVKRSMTLSAAALVLCAGRAPAGPEGAQVVRGNVSISRQGNTTLIRAGDRSIINYRSFDIAGHESVHFVQPNADARVLNRIESVRPTRIDGSLTANGRVYLVNPAGVVFGRGATVNVGGLYAAAGTISDADFLAGNDRFTNLSGRVENLGSITAARGGAVLLAGSSVANAGSIVAPQGSVVFAAGEQAVVSSRESNIQVLVAGSAQPGVASSAAIEHTGTVQAPRGSVTMLAGDVYGLALRSDGLVRAANIDMQGTGRGDVIVSGGLDARDQAAVAAPGVAGRVTTLTSGGDITVTGERVALLGAAIDASGDRGGGNVRVGGDRQGLGDLRNANVLAVNDSTVIKADALTRGDAGDVILYADGATRAHATVSARGGVRGGDGGLIETSGREVLEVDGSRLDATASAGTPGEWLIDPFDVTITTAPTSNGSFGGGDPDLFTPSAGSSIVQASDISSRLSSGTSVTITTGPTGTQQFGNILVNSDITANANTTSPTLTLKAAFGVTMAANTNIRSIGSQPLNVTLIANASDAGDPLPDRGAVRLNPGSSIETGGGNIVIGGGLDPTAALPNLTSETYAAQLRASSGLGFDSGSLEGVVIDGSTLDAGTAGRVTIRGTGASNLTNAKGVIISGGTTVTGSSIAVDGAGGTSNTSAGESYGVEIDSLSTLTASGGEGITIRGLSGTSTSGNNHSGVVIAGTVESTGSGGITIEGFARVNSGTDNAGVRLDGSSALVRTADADIAITGTSRATGNNSDGVELRGGAQVRSTGSGDITIVGNVTNSASSDIAGGSGPNNQIGDSAGTGTVTLRGNTMSLAQTNIRGGGGSLLIQPRATGTTIGIGTGAAGTLQLADDELARISGFPQVTIGATDAGAATTTNVDFSGVADAVTLRGTTLATGGIVSAGGRTVTLDYSGSVTQTGVLAVSNLVLRGSGAYTLTNTGNAVGNLAGNVSGPARFTNSTSFGIGSAGGVTGFTSSGNSTIAIVDGELDVNDPVTVTAGTLTLEAREIDLNALVSGAGSLALQHASAGGATTINRPNPTGPANLDITTADLANVDPNIGALIIGRSDSTTTLSLNDPITFNQNTTLRTGPTGSIAISANVTTPGKAIVFDGPTVLGSDLVLDTTNGGANPAGGLVRFTGTLNADDASNNRTLSVVAPAGAFFAGDVGQTQQLSTLTVSNGPASLSGTIRTANAQVYAGGTTLTGATNLFATGVTFGGTLDSDAPATPRSLLISTGGAGVVTFNAAVGATNPLASIDATGGSITLRDATTTGLQRYTGPVTLGGTLRSTDAGAITLTSRLDLSADASIETAGLDSGDDIIIDGFVNSLAANHDLTLQAGAGDVSFASDIGTDTTGGRAPIGTLTAGGASVSLRNVRTTASQLIDGRANIRGELTSTGTGSIAFSGPVTLQQDVVATTNQGDILFVGGVDSDATARALTLNTGNNGVTRLAGAIGASNALSSLTTNADGTTRISSSLVRTGNDQVYNDDVVLTGNVTVQANDTLFLKTLNADSAGATRNLTINSAAVGADAGETTFGGVVGGVAPVGRITTNAEGITRINSNISSKGMTFGDPVQVLGSVALNAGSETMVFRGTLDAESTATDPLVTLLSLAGGNVDAVPFTFGGNIGVGRRLGGLILGADLPNNPIASTIVFTDALNDAGRIVRASVANTDTFRVVLGNDGLTVGSRQKILALGSINITSAGPVAIGDVTSLGNTVVDASAISIRRRPGGSVQNNVFEDPDRLSRDTGVDFVAGGNIDFTRVPTLSGSGNDPTFVPGSGNIDAEISGFGIRQPLAPVTIASFADPRTGNTSFLLPLDLPGTGPSGTSITTSVYTTAPRTPLLPVQSPAILPGADAQPLAELGIATRASTTKETVNRLTDGMTRIDDLPQGLGGVIGVSALTGNAVAAPRITADAASQALEAYRLFLSAQVVNEDGSPALDESGNAVWADQSEQVRSVFAAGWSRYSERTQKATGAGWRVWLDTFGSTAPPEELEVRDLLDRGAEAVRTLENLGLTPGELQGPLGSMLDKVRPEGVSREEMLAAMTGLIPASASATPPTEKAPADAPGGRVSMR